jgi:capsular polysaccharide biosynthesis protein
VDSLTHDEVRPHIVSDALRRRWPLVVALTLLVTAAFAALALSRAPSYSSSAKVLLRPLSGNALSPDSSRNAQQVTVAMETEAGLVNSPEVAALVSTKLRTTVTAGAKDVSASVPPNTQIVQIRYEASSRDAARAGAQAYADAFLAFRKQLATDTVKHQLEILGQQAKTVSDNLTKVSANAASTKPAPDAAAQVQLYTNRLANLQDSIGNLEAITTDPGSVVTPAAAPASPSGLSPAILIGVGAFLGLLIGLAVAVWRERSDDRVRADEDVSVAGVPVVARLPRAASAIALVGEGASDELAEAFRRIRSAVLTSSERPAVVAVAAAGAPTSHDSGEICADLAVLLAQAENRVCVVDAAMGDGAVASLFDLHESPGLAELLRHERPADADSITETLQRSNDVAVLTQGRDPQGVRELYASANFRTVVSQVKNQFDYVLLAAPSMATSVGHDVALASDAVLLVVGDKRMTHDEVADAVRRSAQLGVPVIGLISVAGSGWAHVPGRRGPRAGATGAAATADDEASEPGAKALQRAGSPVEHDAG